MTHPWELVSGIFTLIFLLAAFYFAILAGLRESGKRGWLFLLATAILGPGFLFDLIYQTYGSRSVAVISQGFIILSGILFLLSVYLSKKELERQVETA